VSAVRTRLALLTAAAALLLVPSCAVASDAAHASAKSGRRPSPPRMTFAWSTLGLPATFSLDETAGSQNQTIPVPAGLHAAVLSGVLHAPASLGSGYLEIDSSTGTALGSVRLPRPSAGAGAVPFHISLAGAPVHDGAVTVSFALRQPTQAPAAQCALTPQPSVSSLATTFTGSAAAPRTIAEFFPPVLSQIIIYTSPTPTPAEQQATLQLAASLVSHYEPITVGVTVRALAPGSPTPAASPDPLTRSVVIRQQQPGGVSIVPAGHSGTVLQLSGSSTTLAEQTSLFSTNLSQLAQVPDAVVDRAASAPHLNTASVYTFGQLNLSTSGSVLGQQSLSFELDQGQLGGPLSSITVHLRAHYTPVVPPTQGTLTVSVNSVQLAATRLTTAGSVSSTFTIPSSLLSRKVTVQLNVAYSPGGSCTGPALPISFSVDPRSYVVVSDTSAPAGAFSALPTAFLGGMAVSMQSASINQLQYAILAVAGLQALTAEPLFPQVVPYGSIADNGLGALIVADAAGVSQLGLDPPLQGNTAQITAGLAGRPAVSFTGGVGSVQSFADKAHHRTVLLITTTAGWHLVAPLFTQLARTGWSSLTGDVYAAGTTGTPVDLTVRDSGIIPFEPPASHRWYLWFLAAGLVALVLIAAAVIRQGRRGRRRDM
jgi:Bacterial cellulose synthase subunit